MRDVQDNRQHVAVSMLKLIVNHGADTIDMQMTLDDVTVYRVRFRQGVRAIDLIPMTEVAVENSFVAQYKENGNMT